MGGIDMGGKEGNRPQVCFHQVGALVVRREGWRVSGKSK